MLIDVLLPQLADNVTAATCCSWLSAKVKTITAGEPLVEIETDKTTFEVESPSSASCTHRCRGGDRTVPVGTVIGVISQGAAAAPGKYPPSSTPESDRASDTSEAVIGLRLPDMRAGESPSLRTP